MNRNSLLSMTDAEAVAFILSHPVSGGKGDRQAQQTEKAQADFTRQLQQVFAVNNAKRVTAQYQFQYRYSHRTSGSRSSSDCSQDWRRQSTCCCYRGQ